MFRLLTGTLAAALLVAAAAPVMAQAPAAPPAAAATPAPQPGTPARLRGTIDSFAGRDLVITTREGEKIAILMNETFTVASANRLTLADLSDNDYLGIVAEEGANGQLVALDVRVFPEVQRGVGEGQRPWDFTPQSTMTNATVATVATEGAGRLVRVTYPNGDKMVMVGPDVPIWTNAPADPSLLVAGAYVIVNSRKLDDGSYIAGSVTVEKDIRPNL